MAKTKVQKTSRLSAIIKKTEKSTVVATGEKFIDVEVWIYEDGKKVGVKKLGFPYQTEKKEIVTEIKKYMKLLKTEEKQKQRQTVIDSEEASADKTVDEVKGLEIK